MSTAVAPNGKTASQAVAAPAKPTELIISYIPLGQTDEITLTPDRVLKLFCKPTRSGATPTYAHIVKFIMMCKSQGLNPYLEDAYLVGFDGKDGPEFNLITAHKALLKRAEASDHYDGMESGVIVMRDDEMTERPGKLVLKGETLIGGWARVYRNDRKVPAYESLNLASFDKNRSVWNTDKPGMIVKCAQAGAMRQAFPSTLANMYLQEEFDRLRDEADTTPHVDTRSKGDRLAERLTLQTTKTPEPETSIEPHAETLESDRQADSPFELQSEDRREPEPASRSQPKAKGQKQMDLGGDQSRKAPAGHDVAFFLKAVGEAKTVDALDAIKNEAQDAWSEGSVDGDDVRLIEAAITKRLATLP